MRRFVLSSVIFVLLSACRPVEISIETPVVTTQPTAVQVTPTFTAIPTFTPVPTATSTPAPKGTVELDFVAQLCNAQWLNGGQHLKTCPDITKNDVSGGYASVLDPTTGGLPAGTPVLLTIPAWNGFSSLFLRYPAFKVQAGDRFQATLRCANTNPCDVEFALEYYDSKNQFHNFMRWDYKLGDPDINADIDLSSLAGQTVDFTLVLRLFHDLHDPQQDNGIWIAPRIFRPAE
jgi:hypothetical protein